MKTNAVDLLKFYDGTEEVLPCGERVVAINPQDFKDALESALEMQEVLMDAQISFRAIANHISQPLMAADAVEMLAKIKRALGEREAQSEQPKGGEA